MSAVRPCTLWCEVRHLYRRLYEVVNRLQHQGDSLSTCIHWSRVRCDRAAYSPDFRLTLIVRRHQFSCAESNATVMRPAMHVPPCTSGTAFSGVVWSGGRSPVTPLTCDWFPLSVDAIPRHVATCVMEFCPPFLSRQRALALGRWLYAERLGLCTPDVFKPNKPKKPCVRGLRWNARQTRRVYSSCRKCDSMPPRRHAKSIASIWFHATRDDCGRVLGRSESNLS